ncbi:roadblock/LC7 domain-containing protein [Glaciihabitans arcticus]|uniref:Roadblock/LC7 domain-containing protein n=1 Tax=Glaciihabitans arcticus TaxID=2668039 RepID=A0A4V2JF46_9MICO|nr:roadblock/LC7 domain-containing protein [Glaciihabitans arcticus]TBN58079.1 roadblock/LC7 domain-containing protein [Glaciihabitans arcticus]
MTAIHRELRSIEIGEAALADMRELAPSLVFAMIVTDDGFELAHAPENTIDGGRFGSMTSSVQALSEAVTRELNIGSSGYMVIAAEKGHVLQLRVPGHPLILAALFDTHETLGKALSISRRCVEKLAADLPATGPTVHP